jgi:hypothetical protein
VLNNIWDTNFPTVQAGEMRFAYAISPHDGGRAGSAEALAARLGESVSSPLVAALVPAVRQGPLRAPTGNFWGHHLVLWLNNLGPGRVTTGVTFPDLAVSGASVATVFEERPVECS